MAVIILSTVNKYGIEGLLIAGFLAGLLQILFGVIKIGRVVKYIPLPVITGFTAGIGMIIFIGQIGNFLGIPISPKEHIWETFIEIIANLDSISIIAVCFSLITILMMVFFPKVLSKIKYIRNIPPSMITLVLASVLVWALALKIPLIGLIPRGFPAISLIKFNLELIKEVLPASFTIAMLGSIEALLCAVVCDGMTNTKHKSDKELISQGINNLVLPFFGGIPSTAAIARSAVNIREGAKTRMSGVIHGIFLLLVLLFLAPFAYYIPKAFLAGVLMVISFRMINMHEIKLISSTGRLDTIVLIATFILTILTDLVFAVQVGMMMAIFLLFARLTQIISITNMEEYDSKGEFNQIINSDPLLKDKVSIYTIHGPFFFGAINIFEQKLSEHMHIRRPSIIIRMKHVPFVDSSALIQLVGFLKERKKNNSRVIFTELWPGLEKKLFKNEEFKNLVSKENIFKTVHQALEDIRKKG